MMNIADQVTPIHGVKPLCRLRWRFEYLDGKRPIYGQWNGAQIAAWSIDKTNLAVAIIEAEMIGSWEIRRMVAIPGPMFATMAWVAAAPVGFRMNAPGPVPDRETRGDIVGLKVMTSSEAITVYIDGSISRRPLTAYESIFKIKEHSTGV